MLKYDLPVQAGEPDKQKKQRAPLKSGVDGDNIARDVLNTIFPAVEYTENDIKYTKYVSATPATKSDVVKLKQQVELLLQKKKISIDPERTEIYQDCFDEIIRQITIDCSVRGLLLVKVRDHYRSLMASYKDLYESSLAWGSRKAAQVEYGYNDLEKTNYRLKEEKRTLELTVNELQMKLENFEKKISEGRAAKEKEHQEEIQFLKKQAQMIKAQIDQINATK